MSQYDIVGNNRGLAVGMRKKDTSTVPRSDITGKLVEGEEEDIDG